MAGRPLRAGEFTPAGKRRAPVGFAHGYLQWVESAEITARCPLRRPR
ncbi:hypothetical protein [Streptomyces ossamyceticus]|uniref:Uncharacterized protein n=1 Tax=Streptomyces ossamyceticus TaxID=249581 RepID=A0ABV2VAW7_9ACTN